ncbi:AGE family epimerase/isomerase [Pedobacter sp. ASV28]|uniref:AGE family epimerase/isomerase n=1 Tax=Pedobacter sp. ASV28 TaxID=2795123 RepID=UPI0018EC7E6F|nr:AGE family epimerase/isomerase [Pedobacter sp. ASV28]
MHHQLLTNLRNELDQELSQLLNWWDVYAVDEENGGFYGKINSKNEAFPAPKGVVLNARILYTFSSAYLLKKEARYLELASRAFNYLNRFFLDEKEGGFYWSLTAEGQLLDGKKQVYGQAFAIYALAEYYKATNEERALNLAKATYGLLEKHSYDKVHTGYIEAHTQDWHAIDDLRLSEKDQNEKKSMNTHLHVIEAYANLYTVWQNTDLKTSIKRLLYNFKTHIIHPQKGHLQLFFTENWTVRSTLISFGHDIEAAWLLLEAAALIDDAAEILIFQDLALKMTDAALNGVHKNGGLLYEYDPHTQHWIKEFHWWPQAEAMVGLFNAWQVSGNIYYLEQSIKTWNFVKQHIKDKEHGEWFWGVDFQFYVMQHEDKAGFWKCPYHNGRACIEIVKRIELELG